ncbi:hypothetical protein [Lachnoclostridium edouardi]|uniref:hypothetical protein n=1 Tax=Lachnoclostridium edouardi TaxID=1926283 RepID=UPI0015E14751|nr:hypothetical protein [Lachnoclostridium edouardi]
MANIKQISDLSNYVEVLCKSQAAVELMNELAKGSRSGEEKGWLALEAVEEHLRLSHE